MRLSIVTTLYCSAPYLAEFHSRVSGAARAFAGDDYELILVNDGSPDNALELALELRSRDPHVCVVDLSRNFGHHQAMWTGLQQARGEWIYLLDCDLEESPEWLEELSAQQTQHDADVAFGVQRMRRGGWRRRLAGAAYYRLLNLLSPVQIPENLMTIRLMSRRYVNALLQHTEATFIMSGLWARTGFRQVPVPFDKGDKRQTTYGLVRCFKLLVHSVTSFSEVPLFAVFYIGLGLMLSASVVATYLVIGALLFGKMLAGWPSLMVSIWFLGGLSLFCQGILGIYLARVYQESKRRPIALIRQIYDGQGGADVVRKLAG
jgi:putative glycosyltransferase